MIALNKRLRRNLRKNLSFYIVISFMTALICILMIASTSTGKTMSFTFDKFMEENHVESGEFYTQTPINNIKGLENEFEVELEEQRYADAADQNVTLRLFEQTNKVNTYTITKGTDIENNTDVLLSERFCEAHSLNPGDKITISGKEFTVSGYMVRPDYLYMLQNMSDSYYNYENFAIAIVSESALDEIEGISSYYTVIYNADNEADFRTAINERYSLLSYISSDTNTRISYPANQGEAIANMALNFAPVLFLIIVMISAVILSRKIKTEQKQIGTLTALGYREADLIKHYVIYAVIPASIGSVIGIISGYLLIMPFADFYFADFEYVAYALQINYPAFFICLIVPLFLYSTVAVLTLHRHCKKSAVSLIYGKSEQKKCRRFFIAERKLSFKIRFKLRVLISHIPRTAVLLFGIVCSGMCILAGFTMVDSLNYTIDGLFEDLNYEYTYYLKTPAAEGYQNAEGAMAVSYQTEHGENVVLCGIDENSKMLKADLISGEYEYGKYYITELLAKQYQLAVGDTFLFYDKNTLEEVSITISGVTEGVSSAYIYTSRQNVSDLTDLDKNTSNVFVSNTPLNIAASTLLSEHSNDDLKESVKSYLNAARGVFYFVTFIGFGLCVLVVYLMAEMIVRENEQNISMLMILGYRSKEINRLVLNANRILIIIGFIVSIPVTLLFCEMAFTNTISEMSIYVTPYLGVRYYILGFIILAGSYEIAVAMLKRKTKNVDLVGYLKDSRE
ncbi:MAG: ABC transporter permease [Lachnospiraceae bacterium]